MRVVVHDYSGHPFQVQLSRELACRGHQVWHLSSADFQTPKGRLGNSPDDNGLIIKALSIGKAFKKEAYFRRRRQEIEFGFLVAKEICAIAPDVVLSSNAPLDCQNLILEAAKAVDARFVFWVQDLYGEAIYRILSRKLGLPGQLVGRWYQALERSMLRKSDAVVVITSDFVPVLERQGIPSGKISVVENWAPLDETPAFPIHPGEHRPLRVLYAGTLGHKHNPELLVAAASRPGVELIVHSEGRVADELRERTAQMDRVSILPWAPFDQLPAILASADILVAMIEEDAGVFSVPSKVLTYLCSARPLLASMPLANRASQIILGANAGLVSSPSDPGAFLANLDRLAQSPSLRSEMGQNGRAYAESHFSISRIADVFEGILA